MDKIKKQYTNGEVTVVWQPDKCIHSAICWKKPSGLPEVFDPKARPWIDMEGASNEKIIEVVKKCPSGALTYFMNNEDTQDPSGENEIKDQPHIPDKFSNIVQVMKNGPILIYGSIIVKDADGTETSKTNVTAFCRCGLSKTKPYCDGAHFDIEFDE